MNESEIKELIGKLKLEKEKVTQQWKEDAIVAGLARLKAY